VIPYWRRAQARAVTVAGCGRRNGGGDGRPSSPLRLSRGPRRA
jgi:hypothetical protein